MKALSIRFFYLCHCSVYSYLHYDTIVSSFKMPYCSVSTEAHAWLKNCIFVGCNLFIKLKCTGEGLFLKTGGDSFIIEFMMTAEQ